MFSNQHQPIRNTVPSVYSPCDYSPSGRSPFGGPPSGRPPYNTAWFGRVRRTARGLAALAVVLGTTLGALALSGAKPASAWVPPGPSGMPVSQGATTHLNCNSININGADVISYIEAPQENHGTVHPGQELWVSYQIHKPALPQQWPLSANNGVHTTDAPMLHFNAPTNTMISGPVQLFTPGAGKLVSWPQLVPSAMHNFGDLQGHPVYPGKNPTWTVVEQNTGPAAWVDVQANSKPTGSYNDGFYLEVRFPVRVVKTGTVTVQPIPTFGGEDGTWNVFNQHYEEYTCSQAGGGATGLSFNSVPYILYA